jgi:hypothetical protein
MNVYRGILRGAATACLLAAASFAADAKHSPLTVQASATEVHLQWFEPTPVVVERKAADGEFEVLGIASDGEFTDRTIDRRQIYTYRATPIHGLAPKIVTVGPPPAGFSTVVANPNQHSKYPENFGQFPCFVLDQNGDPILSYVWVNPSGNLALDNADTELYFVSWNRSSNSFNAPVEIAVTGDIAANELETAFNYPQALARDPVNNTLAIAYHSYSANAATAYVNIAFSTDGGQTWASQVVTSAAVNVNDFSNIALALYNGTVYLIYYVGSAGPAELVTGMETTAPSTWSTQHFPSVSGYTMPLNYYSIALDSNGVPAVVLTRQPNSDSGAFPTYFWRPIANTLVEVLTDNGDGGESYSYQSDYAVQLVFNGTAPYILYGGARTANPTPNQYLTLAYSTTGATGTWTTTYVPANGPIANDDTIQEPLGISVGSAGQVTVVSSDLGNYSVGGCGYTSADGTIELAQTTNLSTWSVCALGGANGPQFNSVQPVVHYGVNDDLFVAFVDPDDGNALPNGVNLWANYPNGTCSYSVTANALGVDNAAGSYSFILNAGAGCSWVEASNTSWLTLTSAASGTGTATISFTAAANTAGTAREGTLTVAGIPFIITQSACSFGPSTGLASLADLQLLINEALGTQSPANDLNKDGVVNVVDIEIEVDAILGLGCAAS